MSANEIPKSYFVIPAIGIALVFALIVIPSWQLGDTTIFLTNKDGGTPVSCAPDSGLVLAQNLTDLCDVIITSPSNGQIIEYNGTYWVNVEHGGVTTLTSSNGAITLNASSGNILITPEWELLCENALAVSGTSISCSNFDERRFLMVTVETRLVTSGLDIGIQFNGDTGNNYAWRKSANGGADTTAINDNNCLTQNPSASMNQLHTLYINNNLASENKALYGTVVNSGASGAGNLAGRMEIACKWANTTDQITTITVMRDAGTGSYDTDTRIKVWGYD